MNTTIRRIYPYYKESAFEFLRMIRNPGFAGPFLGLPPLLYLLFGVLLFGAAIKNDPSWQLYMFLGFVTFGVMGPGIFGFGVAIANEREHGLYRLKRALPVPPFACLFAKLMMAMLFVAIIMLSMAAASYVGPLRFSVTKWLSMSAVSMLGALPFCAMGLFIGTLATGKSAPAFANLIYLPMIYLSGFLIPLPPTMQWITMLSPAFHLHQLTLLVIGAPSAGSPITHAVVLWGMTAVLTRLAVMRLSRIG